MLTLRELIFYSQSQSGLDSNFVNFYKFAANMTFQGLIARNTKLYDTISFINYEANTGYSR